MAGLRWGSVRLITRRITSVTRITVTVDNERVTIGWTSGCAACGQRKSYLYRVHGVMAYRLAFKFATSHKCKGDNGETSPHGNAITPPINVSGKGK